MPAEIERKFLLSEAPSWLHGCPCLRIEQGYLAITEDLEVRLRRAGDRDLLTVKRGHGKVREEVEISIGRDDFEALWPLTESRRVIKTRRVVELEGGLRAEVDVFEGVLDGLLIAEVEFDSERQSRDFQPPPWLQQEITGDDRYANQSLAIKRPGGRADRSNGEVGEDSRDRIARSRAHGSRRFSLKGGERLPEGMRRVALGRIEKAQERLIDAEHGDLGAAIHATRKDLKKARAVLRLIREGLGEDRYKAENVRLRDAGRLLAPERDADAKLETLDALAERPDSDLGAEGCEAWRVALAAERSSNTPPDSVRERLAQARELIATAGGEAASWRLGPDSWKLIGPGLERSYREGQGAMGQSRRAPSVASVHEWRKRAKDLRYQLEIVQGAWPAFILEITDQLHHLTDQLGGHHDLSVLRADLAAREGLAEKGALERMIEERQIELLEGALDLGERIYAEKPKAFRRRVRSYWRSWR